MHVPVEVLALVAVAVVLLLCALALRVRAERLLRAQLDAKDRPIQPIVVAPDAPPPAPHLDHAWANKPFGERRGYRLYRCTVPNCTAIDCRSGNA